RTRGPVRPGLLLRKNPRPPPRPRRVHHPLAPLPFHIRHVTAGLPAPAGARGGTMKFSWFHLMPWRWLPADFRERYHGVWVDVPNRLYDPERGHALYNEYLDTLEYADRLGFDAIGVNEHHQNAYGMMPSPNIMAAALARRATNAMILVLGDSIALYNPPIRVAEEFAMLDVITGGRLIAGFPVG